MNSLIFAVVRRNILYCLHLGKNYLWTKPASNKSDRPYQRTSHKHIYWPNVVWKNHLVLGLIEKEYNKRFDYVIIVQPIMLKSLSKTMIRFGL